MRQEELEAREQQEVSAFRAAIAGRVLTGLPHPDEASTDAAQGETAENSRPIVVDPMVASKVDKQRELFGRIVVKRVAAKDGVLGGELQKRQKHESAAPTAKPVQKLVGKQLLPPPAPIQRNAVHPFTAAAVSLVNYDDSDGDSDSDND